jgi:hypothetical protein
LIFKAFAYGIDDPICIYDDDESMPGSDDGQSMPGDENNGSRTVLGECHMLDAGPEIGHSTTFFDENSAEAKDLLRLAEDYCKQNIETLERFHAGFCSLKEALANACAEYSVNLATTRMVWTQVQEELNTATTQELHRCINNRGNHYDFVSDCTTIITVFNTYINSVRALVGGAVKGFDSFLAGVLAIILDWKQMEDNLKAGEHLKYGEAEALYFRCVMLQLYRQAASCSDPKKYLSVANKFESDYNDDEKDTDLPDVLSIIMVGRQDFDAFKQEHGANIDREWEQIGGGLDSKRTPSDNEDQGLELKRRREVENSPESEDHSIEQPPKRARK